MSRAELDERNHENELREIESILYLEKNDVNNLLTNQLLNNNNRIDFDVRKILSRQAALKLSRLQRKKIALAVLFKEFNATAVPLKKLLLLRHLHWFNDDCELQPASPTSTEYIEIIEDETSIKRISAAIDESKKKDLQDFFSENSQSR